MPTADTRPVTLDPRARLDEAAERYHLAEPFSEARRTAHADRQAALADIIAEHARWVACVPGSARAYLTGAYLADANLADAYLADANLADAYLTDANLAGANLARANLTGADLTGANLAGANLTDADLAPIWEDIDDVLRGAPHEVPALLAALREGRVDGSTYTGACACLVGTLENAAAATGRRLAIPHRPERLAERWFAAIRKGDTPENSAVCALTADYVEWWLSPESEAS